MATRQPGGKSLRKPASHRPQGFPTIQPCEGKGQYRITCMIGKHTKYLHIRGKKKRWVGSSGLASEFSLTEAERALERL